MSKGLFLTQDTHPQWVGWGSNPCLYNWRLRMKVFYYLQQCQCSGGRNGTLQIVHQLSKLPPQVTPITLNILSAEASSWPCHPNEMQSHYVHRKENKKKIFGDWHCDYHTRLVLPMCSKRQMGDLHVHELSSQLLKMGHIPVTSHKHIISFVQAFC